MIKLLYKTVSMLVSVLGGMLAGMIFHYQRTATALPLMVVRISVYPDRGAVERRSSGLQADVHRPRWARACGPSSRFLEALSNVRSTAQAPPYQQAATPTPP